MTQWLRCAESQSKSHQSPHGKHLWSFEIWVETFLKSSAFAASATKTSQRQRVDMSGRGLSSCVINVLIDIQDWYVWVSCKTASKSTKYQRSRCLCWAFFFPGIFQISHNSIAETWPLTNEATSRIGFHHISTLRFKRPVPHWWGHRLESFWTHASFL